MWKRLRVWALFNGPWHAVLRLLALPYLWLRREQLRLIFGGGDDSTNPL